nr:MAG TPA: hypothetical protein [Caudoviricetes sp.]
MTILLSMFGPISGLHLWSFARPARSGEPVQAA